MEARKDFIIADYRDKVSKYEDELLEDKAILVKENGKIIGILKKRALLKSKLSLDEVEIGHLASPVKLFEESELKNINKVLKYLIENKSKFVIIGDVREIKYYYKREDIIKEHLDKISSKSAEEVMKKDLVTVNEKDHIIKALHIMKDKKVDRLIVLDDNNELVGIITLGDMIKYLIIAEKEDERLESKKIKDKHHFNKIEVKEIMSENLKIANPKDNLEKIFNILEDNNIESIIITKENNPYQVLGIITYYDYLLELYKELNKEKEIEITYHLEKVVLDEFDKKWIENKFNKLRKKYPEIFKNVYIHIDIRKIREHLEDNKLERYLVRFRIFGPSKKFLVDIEDNSITYALSKAFKILDKQLLKYKKEFSEKEVNEILNELVENFY